MYPHNRREVFLEALWILSWAHSSATLQGAMALLKVARSIQPGSPKRSGSVDLSFKNVTLSVPMFGMTGH